MSFDPVTAALDIGKSLIEKIWPDPSKQAEEMFKLTKLAQDGKLTELNAEVQLMLGQIEINKIEAGSKSFFVAGARPFILWICGITLGLSYLVPLVMEWVAYWSCTEGCIIPVRMDMGALMPLLLGLLGLGTMRSVDKRGRVQTDKIG